MKKSPFLILITFLVLLMHFSISNAQETIYNNPNYQPKRPLRERLFTGGSLGLQFGSVTYVDVSPILGYRFTDKLSAGVGATYIYVKDKRYIPTYTSSSYGGRLFGQYRIIESVMAYSEFEILNTDVYDDITYRVFRTNIYSLLLGGGYVQSMGGNSNISIMALWNVIEDRYSIYTNPIIRVGFNVGF